MKYQIIMLSKYILKISSLQYISKCLICKNRVPASTLNI